LKINDLHFENILKFFEKKMRVEISLLDFKPIGKESI